MPKEKRYLYSTSFLLLKYLRDYISTPRAPEKGGFVLLLVLEFVIAPIVVGITLQYSSHLLDEFFELRKTQKNKKT